MNRNALIAGLASLGLVGGIAVAGAATSHDRPVPIIAAGASSVQDEPTTTSTRPDPTTTLLPGDDDPTTTTVVGVPDGDDPPATTIADDEDEPDPTTTSTMPPTTSTTEPRRESTTTTTTTSTTEPTRQTLELWCGINERERGPVCEWERLPERTTHIVLVREDADHDAAPVWRTDDLRVHRHVDDTAEPGRTYAYHLDAYGNDDLLATSNSIRVTRARPAPASALHIECGTPGNGGGPASVVCEWNDPPAGANRWVLMRELEGPSQPIWRTEDMSVRRHVDETAEAGVTYSYRISAYDGDTFIATSNPVRITAGGEG